MVREAVGNFSRGVTENMKEVRGKLYHVITGNNRIVQFRIGENGKLILENTVKSINLQTKKLSDARKKIIDAGKRGQIK